MSSARALATARRRLIFPLDVETVREADRLVAALAPEIGLFKIGKQLFVKAGPDVVRRVQRRGGAVFLDLKFHDIPQTVAHATVEAARLGVQMVDVHAAGGGEMMRAAAQALRRTCRAEGLTRPLLIGVTVLTSLDDRDLRAVGVPAGARRQVMRLARLAATSGLGGVVASPHEITAIRRACGPKFAIVTPGVRPAAAVRHDQKRIMTPEAAMRAGADYLVVGRPIRDAASPVEAARAIVGEMAAGMGRAR